MRGLRIRADLDAAELRALAGRDKRSRAAARLYAIAHVLDAKSRAEAARLCGMDRQALRDAVVRYNAEGVDGLADRSPPGREPRLTAGEQAALAALILRGPDTERSGISSWTLADLCWEAELRWNKSFHPASMSRVVRRLGFSRQKARQVHPQSDPAAQAAFSKRGCKPRSMTLRVPIRTGGSPSGSRTVERMRRSTGLDRRAVSATAGG